MSYQAGLPSWGAGLVIPGREVHTSPLAIQVHTCKSHPGCCRLRRWGTGRLSYSQSPMCHWDSWWSTPPHASLPRQEHKSTWENEAAGSFAEPFQASFHLQTSWTGTAVSQAPALSTLALPRKVSIGNEQKHPNSYACYVICHMDVNTEKHYWAIRGRSMEWEPLECTVMHIMGCWILFKSGEWHIYVVGINKVCVWKNNQPCL